MVEKRGPKGPRNKVRQVVLVDGHPDCIFDVKERTLITIRHGSTVIKMGNIGPEKIEGLKQIPGIEVIEVMKPHRRAKTLPSVISVKTTKTSTQLTVAAVDKESLDRAVATLAQYLAENGVSVHERCQWVCVLDKGKEQVTPVQIKDNPVQSGAPPVQVEEKPVLPEPSALQPESHIIQPKKMIMDYLKTRSSFNAGEISDTLNIPLETVRSILVDLGFIISKTRKNVHEMNGTTITHKGRYGTTMEIIHARG